MAKVGVVLSGCGVYDGAEIHESVLTLLALDERDVEIVCMAPSGPQLHVIDHATGGEAEESRDILVESARIARGEIRDVADVTAGDVDALVFPGGFGAAKNLCDFAVKGPDCAVNADVARLVREVHAAGKPLGFACIAPALAAAIFRGSGVELDVTVGADDMDAADAIRAMGAVHTACAVTQSHTDAGNKVATTPAYMLAERIREVKAGIDEMVEQVLGMIG